MAERAAIVTGASSGIGLAIARVLGEEGYGVTLAARRAREARRRRRRAARTTASTCTRVAANVADEEEIKKVVAAHRDRYGRLDVLVNNAGVGVGASVAEIETKRMDMQLDINLRSIVLFYRECVADAARGRRRAQERARRQHLVDLRQARRGWLSVYSATKHGVVGWTEAMNKELGERGDQVDRALPRVRRHADDRLRQGAGRPPRR